MSKKAYIGVQPYIESTNSRSAIVLPAPGISITEGTIIVPNVILKFKISFSTLTSSGFSIFRIGYLFGSTNMFYSLGVTNKKFCGIKLMETGGAGFTTYDDSPTLVEGEIYTIEIVLSSSSRYIKVNNTTIKTETGSLPWTSLPDVTFFNIHSLSSMGAKMRLHSYSIIKDGILREHYRPTGENSLLRESKNVAYSSSTGSFSAQPTSVAHDINNIYIGAQDFLQSNSSTGSEVINTGIVSKVGTSQRVVMYVAFTELPSSAAGFFGTNYNGSFVAGAMITSTGKWQLRTGYSSDSIHSVAASTGPSVNTIYKVECYWGPSSQYMKVDDVTVVTDTQTAYTGYSGNLYLYNFVLGTASSYVSVKMKLYGCTIYQDDVIVADYIPSGKYLYNNVTKTKVGTSSAYTSGTVKARRVKKMFIGVNDTARLVYTRYITSSFTSSPIPTNWDTTNNTSTNEYGRWELSGLGSNLYRIADGDDTTTSVGTIRGGFANFDIILPPDVTICPETFRCIFRYTKTLQRIDGYNPETKAWETLYQGNSTYSTKTTITPTVSASTYYSKFGLYLEPYSTATYPTVYTFDITKGSIKYPCQ